MATAARLRPIGPKNIKYQRDWDLVRKAQAGDQQAWSEIVSALHGRTYSVCSRMAGMNRAEDLTQDCFLRLVEKIGQWRGGAALATWMYRLVVNQVLMQLRKKRTAMIDAAEEWQDITPVIDKQLEQIPERLWLDQAMLRLPFKEQQAIRLRYYQQHTLREMAAETGISLQGVKANLWRARQSLREMMEEV